MQALRELHTEQPALLDKAEKQVASMEELTKNFPLNDPKVRRPSEMHCTCLVHKIQIP